MQDHNPATDHRHIPVAQEFPIPCAGTVEKVFLRQQNGYWMLGENALLAVGPHLVRISEGIPVDPVRLELEVPPPFTFQEGFSGKEASPPACRMAFARLHDAFQKWASSNSARDILWGAARPAAEAYLRQCEQRQQEGPDGDEEAVEPDLLGPDGQSHHPSGLTYDQAFQAIIGR